VTPADELTAAADKLRAARFAGAMTATPAVAALVRARDPIAKLLTGCAELHEAHLCDKHEGCAVLGCQWCGDEDWPCADMRNTLAVARAINGGQP
jgi:hypothetical protein